MLAYHAPRALRNHVHDCKKTPLWTSRDADTVAGTQNLGLMVAIRLVIILLQDPIVRSYSMRSLNDTAVWTVTSTRNSAHVFRCGVL